MTIKNKLSCLLVLLLVGVSIQGQNKAKKISGYVTDSKTGEIVSDANIFVGQQIVKSNEYGYYSTQLPLGKYTVRVAYLGFTTLHRNIELESDTILSFPLEKGLNLDEVVVTSNKNKNIDSRGLGNMRVDVAQLRVSPLFLGERDVIKTLQFLPGVSAGMEGSSQLNIRGGTGDQTLYLMDDVPVYNQNHTFGFFSMFNPDALLSVDLYKGGIPSYYGDRLSGVASISLKDGNDKKQQTAFTLGLLGMSLSLEGPIKKDKISYLFTARRSFLDLLYNGVMALSQSSGNGGAMLAFYDVNGKISWKINPNTKLSYQVYTGYDDLYGMNNDKSFSGERTKEKFGFGWRTFMNSLRLTSNLKPNLFLSTSLYYTQLTNFNYYRNKIEGGENGKSSIDNTTSSKLHEFGLRTSLEQKTSANNKLVYGINLSEQKYQPNNLYQEIHTPTINNKQVYNSDKLSLLSASVYINDEFRWRTWLLNAGLRASLYNNTQKNEYVLEPRLRLNKFLDEKNKLMLAYDMMHQPVHSINEMNYNTQTDFWVPFNEDVLPRSQQISIGWKNYTTKNLTFSVEAYYKKMDNLLMIKNLENYLDFHTDYANGSGTSKGLEFMAEYSKGFFSSWLSYTLSKSERTFEGTTYPFKYDAPNDISAFASYIVHKKANTLNTLSVNMQYKTGYPYYIPEVSYPSMGLPTQNESYLWYGDVNKVDYVPNYPNIRLSSYFRTDINFTMEQKMKHGNRIWQFSLLNATGRNNPYAVYRKNGGYRAFVLIPFLPSFSFTRSF